MANTNSTRKRAALRTLADTKLHWIASVVQNLRREERVFLADFALAADVTARIAVHGALCRLRAMIADFAGIPRRPQAPMLKGPKGAQAGMELIVASGPESSNGLNSVHPAAETSESADVSSQESQASEACDPATDSDDAGQPS